MKRMKDNAIEAGLRRVSTGYNRYGTFTIDESNRPISFNMGFIPTQLVDKQTNLKYGADRENQPEDGLYLSGLFANDPKNTYEQFLKGKADNFETWGLFLIKLDTLGVNCYMTGYLSLTKDTNGKPIIRYCRLTGYNGDDDTSGYLEISDNTIALGIFTK